MQNPPEYPPCRRCAECHDDVPDADVMYAIAQGYYVCEKCFLDFVADEYTPESLAVELGIKFVKAGELNE